MAGHISVIEKGKSSIGRIVLLSILYFFFIYSFQIPGLPYGFVSYRLVLVLLFVYTCFASNFQAVKFGKTKASYMVKKYLWWNVFILAYVSLILFVFGIGDGESAIPSYVNMLIVLPLFYISGKYIFRDVEELMTVLYIGCVIQATIIIIATVNPAIENFLKYLYLGSTSDIDSIERIETMTTRGYHMGFHCFTSQGSLLMSTGQIGASYFLMKSKGRKFVLHLTLFLFTTLATSLLARTGLFISVACLLIVLFYKGKSGSGGFSASIFTFAVAILIASYIIGNFSSNSYLSENFNRMSGMFNNGLSASYFDEWRGQGEGENVVPPISFNTIVGLGIKKGTSGAGVRTVVDGGFLINYSSMGLIMAIINYLLLFSFFSKTHHLNKNVSFKCIIVIMSIILLIGEIKEHFIYQFYFICITFVAFSLMEKEEAHKQLNEYL